MTSIQELLRETIGFDTASVGVPAVERAVRERLRVNSLDIAAYTAFVRGSSTELQALIEEIIVPETWFMRDAAAFTPVVQLARDEWLTEPGRTVRLLSLPCCSGEEPYSLAISLLEAGISRERFAIDGIDISERALAKAARGLYGQNSFRGTSSQFRERFFDVDAGGHRLRDDVRTLVRFRTGNLSAPATLAALTAYDVVFCRNLLIYFDPQAQNRAVDALEHLLAPDGVLVVAPSETHLLLSRPVSWVRHPGSFAFRRLGTTPPIRPPRQPVTVAPSLPRPAVLRGGGLDVPRLAALPVAPPPPPHAAAPARLDQATRLADQGRVSEAVALCEQHLAEAGPAAGAFQLLGLLHDATGDHDEALACYRRSLYLDPQNGEVLIHLALLLDKLDRTAEARLVRERYARLSEGTSA